MKRRSFAVTFSLSMILLLSFQNINSEAVIKEEVDKTHLSTLTKDWTVLVYMCGDNNLEPFAIDDINEMEYGGGTNGDVNVVVMVDRSSLDYEVPDYTADWSETRYYVIQSDTNMDVIASPINASLGELNMGDPQTLRDFVDWGLIAFPADKTALIIWDHGSGLDGTCWDDDDGDFLTINEVQTALTGYYFDIIGFDACVMGQIEIVYELKDLCGVVITSLYNTPGDGWAYDAIVSYLISNPSITSSNLASHICTTYVDSYSLYDFDVTLSAYNTTIIADLISEINSLSSELSAVLPAEVSAIYEALDAVDSYDPFFVTELYAFLTEISSRIGGSIATAANNLKTKLDTALIASESSLSVNPYGLWIFLPILPYNHSFEFYNHPLSQYVSSYENIYYDLDFVKDSNWDSFLLDWQPAIDSFIPSVNYPSAYSDYMPTYGYIFIQADLPANTLGYSYQAELTMVSTVDLDMFVWTEEYYYGLPCNLFINSYFGLEGETESAIIPLSEATTVFFLIYSYEGYGSYTLNISEIEYNDDIYEENDNINYAAYLDVNAEYDLFLCDDDYYEIELIEEQFFEVTLDFDYYSYDMDLAVLDDTGEILDISEEYSTTEELSFIAPYTGSYYILVYLYSGEIGGQYTLTLTALDGPFITHVYASPSYVYEGDAIVITATVIGINIIEQVILSYSYSNTISWTNITMVLSPDGNYTATIPGATGVDYVDIYIYARDSTDSCDNAGQYRIDIYEETPSFTSFDGYLIPLGLIAIGFLSIRKRLKK